jgi:threonine synthase
MTVIVDSTAHHLKFADFQQKYFDNALPREYGVNPREALKNKPVDLPASALEIARYLKLSPKTG